MTSTEPVTSSLVVAPRLRISRRYIAATVPAMMPKGTLMKKTHRHEAHPVKIPPRRPPTAPPAPATALQAPMALGRRGPWKVVTMMVKVAGERIAPPTPWIARMVIICVPVWATPAPILARVNRMMPVM